MVCAVQTLLLRRVSKASSSRTEAKDIAYAAGLPGKAHRKPSSAAGLRGVAQQHLEGDSLYRQMLLCRRPSKSAADDALMLPRHPTLLRRSGLLRHLCFSLPKHWRSMCAAPCGGRHTLFRRSCCAGSARLAAPELRQGHCMCSWPTRKGALQAVFSCRPVRSCTAASGGRQTLPVRGLYQTPAMLWQHQGVVSC